MVTCTDPCWSLSVSALFEWNLHWHGHVWVDSRVLQGDNYTYMWSHKTLRQRIHFSIWRWGLDPVLSSTCLSVPNLVDSAEREGVNQKAAWKESSVASVLPGGPTWSKNSITVMVPDCWGALNCWSLPLHGHSWPTQFPTPYSAYYMNLDSDVHQLWYRLPQLICGAGHKCIQATKKCPVHFHAITHHKSNNFL